MEKNLGNILKTKGFQSETNATNNSEMRLKFGFKYYRWAFFMVHRLIFTVELEVIIMA